MKLNIKILVLLFLPLIYQLNISNSSFSNHKNNIEKDTLEINCDSIYNKKGFSISLIKYEDENDGYFGEKNSVFVFSKKVNGKKIELYRDSIFSKVQVIEFKDFNNDKVKDILVQNISDVRSNWTYSLYLINPKTYALKKVKGFEEIKVPRYNSKYNIIENYVMSGRNWTSFYKIKKDKVYDYNIVIYDGENEKGMNTYEKDYASAIQKIIKKK